MGVLDTLKETVGLIQKVDNIELYRRMLDLQAQVQALVDDNRSLKERLAIRDQLSFRENSYFRGDEGPYCSPCWDTRGILVRLHVRADHYPQCPSCKSQAVDSRHGSSIF